MSARGLIRMARRSAIRTTPAGLASWCSSSSRLSGGFRVALRPSGAAPDAQIAEPVFDRDRKPGQFVKRIRDAVLTQTSRHGCAQDLVHVRVCPQVVDRGRQRPVCVFQPVGPTHITVMHLGVPKRGTGLLSQDGQQQIVMTPGWLAGTDDQATLHIVLMSQRKRPAPLPAGHLDPSVEGGFVQLVFDIGMSRLRAWGRNHLPGDIAVTGFHAARCCECVNRGCGRIKNLGGLELIEVNA